MEVFCANCHRPTIFFPSCPFPFHHLQFFTPSFDSITPQTMSSVMALGPNAPTPPQAAVGPSAPPLSGRVVAFTTPPNYSPRLSRLLSLRGAAPLPLPTIAVGPTPQELQRFLHANSIEHFAGVAFTSRTGISAFSLALEGWAPPPLPDSGPTFIVAALGKDAELFSEDGFVNKLCGNPTRIRVLVPDIASPASLVKSLGFGNGRRILCPVPYIVDLTEPPVIPDFIKDLEAAGWNPVRVAAYETRWMGPKCVEGLVTLDGNLDAILFTSTAEVEGFLKGLEEFGWHWGAVRRRWPEIVVGAHGPVTAKGAESFGVAVDVVSERFSSFDGVLDALELKWRGCCGER